VLEKQLLNVIYVLRTLRVVALNVLLDYFLVIVKEECKAAVKNNQNVLLLVFRHKDDSTYRVTIRSNAIKTFYKNSAPWLKINWLKLVVSKEA
jgi:hypothetical protein